MENNCFVHELDDNIWIHRHKSSLSTTRCPSDSTYQINSKSVKYQIWYNGTYYGTFSVDNHGFMLAKVPLRASGYAVFDLLPEGSDKSKYDLLKRVGTACLDSALSQFPLLNNLDVEMHVTQLYTIKLEPVYYELWRDELYYGIGMTRDDGKLVTSHKATYKKQCEYQVFQFYLIPARLHTFEKTYDPTLIVGVATFEEVGEPSYCPDERDVLTFIHSIELAQETSMNISIQPKPTDWWVDVKQGADFWTIALMNHESEKEALVLYGNAHIVAQRVMQMIELWQKSYFFNQEPNVMFEDSHKSRQVVASIKTRSF